MAARVDKLHSVMAAYRLTRSDSPSSISTSGGRPCEETRVALQSSWVDKLQSVIVENLLHKQNVV